MISCKYIYIGNLLLPDKGDAVKFRVDSGKYGQNIGKLVRSYLVSARTTSA